MFETFCVFVVEATWKCTVTVFVVWASSVPSEHERLWPPPHVNTPASTESTTRFGSIESESATWSASESPAFVTLSVKLLAAPPAVTVGSAKCFATESCTSSWTAVWSCCSCCSSCPARSCRRVATVAVLSSVTELSTVEASFTWIVKAWLAPAARPDVVSR